MEPILPEVTPGQLLLVIAPSRFTRLHVLELAARLALRGPVTVFDNGNCFDAYLVARSVRRQTPDLAAVLGRIHIARSFTCYQAAALLARSPATSTPKLVLDLLSTFYDENVALPECTRLLTECTRHLQRLSRAAPVVVSASPPSAHQVGRLPLLRQLEDTTEKTLVFLHPLPQPPLALF